MEVVFIRMYVGGETWSYGAQQSSAAPLGLPVRTTESRRVLTRREMGGHLLGEADVDAEVDDALSACAVAEAELRAQSS